MVIETYIWQALKQRLLLLPSLPDVAWPGDTYEPTGAMYISPMIVYGPPASVELSSRKQDRRGAFMLRLSAAVSDGIGDVSLHLAGQIAEHYHKTSLRYRGVCVRVNEAPEIMGGYRDGGYWHQPIRVNWRTYA